MTNPEPFDGVFDNLFEKPEPTRNLMSPRTLAEINRNRELRIRNLTAERDMLIAEVIKLRGAPSDRWYHWGLAGFSATIGLAAAWDVINAVRNDDDLWFVASGLVVGVCMIVTAVYLGLAAKVTPRRSQ